MDGIMKRDEVPLSLPLPGSVAVVIPSYNAGARIGPVIESVLKVCDKIIVVDDGSTDGSVEALAGLPLSIVRLDENRGKGHALFTGYGRALEDGTVNCVASLDADGQHDPAELPGLYAAFRESGADMIIGSRCFEGEGIPWKSRLGNRVTALVTRLLLGVSLPDTQSGYRLLSRRFLESVTPLVKGGRYETEMELLVRAIGGGYEVRPVGIKTIYEKGNPSSHFNRVGDSWRIYRTLGTTLWQVRQQGRAEGPGA